MFKWTFYTPTAAMVHEQDNLAVGREGLIADGEGDRSSIEAKDDAALLVSDCNRDALHFSGNLLADCMP